MPRSVRELNELVRTHRSKIVGLFETKIDTVKVQSIQHRLGFKHGLMIDPRGIVGGLAL